MLVQPGFRLHEGFEVYSGKSGVEEFPKVAETLGYD
jgi:hypothetical protein